MSHGFPLRRSDSPNVPGAMAAALCQRERRRWPTSPFPVIQAARGAPISSRALRLRACRHGIAVFIPLTPGAVALGRRPSQTSCHPAPMPTSARAALSASALATQDAKRPSRSRAKRVLRTKLSGLSLREAYGGRRAHCRPPSLSAGPARQLGEQRPCPVRGCCGLAKRKGVARAQSKRGAQHACPPGYTGLSLPPLPRADRGGPTGPSAGSGGLADSREC